MVERVELGDHMVLHDREGAGVPVLRCRLELYQAGDQLAEVRLAFAVNADVWRRIDADALFHLTPEARGPVFAGGFQPGDVELDVRLARASLPLVALRAETAADAARLFAGSRPTDELARTESWYALHVKQPLGRLKTGFRTVWADTFPTTATPRPSPSEGAGPAGGPATPPRGRRGGPSA